jgi:hypothetical protein
MAVVDTKILGYGGSAEIAVAGGLGSGTQVLITSGQFDKAVTPSYLEPLDIPPSSSSRSRVGHADGVESYTGSLAFDVTASALALITTSTLLSRYYSFDVGIDDGNDAYAMLACNITNLTLTGAAGGLINASIGFVAAAEHGSSVAVKNAFIRTEEPLGYWWSGNSDVRDWSLTMNQNVIPMYSNQNVSAPKYLKVGLVDYSLQVTTYDAVQTHNVIYVATTSFTLTGNTTSEGYSFGGVTELGTYTHTFETAALMSAGSGGTIIA